MMSQQSLDYERPQRVPRGWGTVLALVSVAPVLSVALFCFGAGLLQDELINGDGRSWQRAFLRMAVPAALISGSALLVAAWALWRFPQVRWTAVMGASANAAAIAFIAYATVTA